MKTYTISHPINGKMNHDCVDSVEYMDICDLSANSLEEAFKLAQNDFNEDYRQGNVRSTSVGDIIIDVEEDKSYLVKGTGFFIKNNFCSFTCSCITYNNVRTFSIRMIWMHNN